MTQDLFNSIDYATIFFAAAAWRFHRKDITS